jgi:hypothetical protein
LDHPIQKFAWIGCKPQLQQLLPHLFLRSAQKDDIAGGSARASEDATPKVEKLSKVAKTAPSRPT